MVIYSSNGHPTIKVQVFAAAEQFLALIIINTVPQPYSGRQAGRQAGRLAVVVALNVYEYATRSFRRYAQLSDHLWLSIPYLHLENLYDRHIFSNKIPATLCLCVGNVFDLSWTGTRLQAMAPYKQDSGKIHSLHRDTWCSTAGFLTLNLT